MIKLLEKLTEIFSNLFNGAKKTWKKLSPEVQDALLVASKIVDVINDNVQSAPEFVIDILIKQFPGLDVPKLVVIVKTVSDDLHIAENTNIDDLPALIANIQKLLAATRPENGKTWGKISHTAYLAIAVLLAPVSTKLAAIISLAEYVYHDLIKGGKVVALNNPDADFALAA